MAPKVKIDLAKRSQALFFEDGVRAAISKEEPSCGGPVLEGKVAWDEAELASYQLFKDGNQFALDISLPEGAQSSRALVDRLFDWMLPGETNPESGYSSVVVVGETLPQSYRLYVRLGPNNGIAAAYRNASPKIATLRTVWPEETPDSFLSDKLYRFLTNVCCYLHSEQKVQAYAGAD